MVPIYALVSLFSYLAYHDAVYFELVRDCYEPVAIASFFSLLCHYVAPTLHEQKEYFRDIKPKNWVPPICWLQRLAGGHDKGMLRRPESGLTWFNERHLRSGYWPSLTCNRSYGSPYSSTALYALSSP